jgi:membrane protein DedA with SNARE-associated domain
MTSTIVLFLALCSAGLLVNPLPEDVILMTAGYLIADGARPLASTLALCLVGIGCRDSLVMLLGRSLGHGLLERRWLQRLLSKGRIERSRQLLLDNQPKAILIARFLPGLRVPIFLVAGTLGLPWRTFFLFDGLGLCVTVPLEVFLGYHIGPSAVQWFLNTSGWQAVFVVAFVVVMVLISFKRRAASDLLER